MSLCSCGDKSLSEPDSSPVLGITLFLSNKLRNGTPTIGPSESPDTVKKENCWVYWYLHPNIVPVLKFVPEIYTMK